MCLNKSGEARTYLMPYFILNRADSSAVIQAHCSVGLGMILQKLYQENIRYEMLQRFAFILYTSLPRSHSSRRRF